MKKWLCVLLAAALVCIGAACGREDASVTFFKAGKADAAVVQCGGYTVLVDTGLAKNGGELTEALEALGAARIDVLILSHFDKDHVGGAAAVLEDFEVGAVYQSNYPKDSDEYAAYTAALAAAGIEPVTVSDTVSLRLGGLQIEIDGPAEEEYADDPSNNSSLIVTVTHGQTTLLFAGDAETVRMAEYLEDFARPAGTVILKVPYHGHWQKGLTEFLTAVMPDTAVIPCSKSEPDEEELAKTLSALEALGAEVYRTYEGDVTLAF